MGDGSGRARPVRPARRHGPGDSSRIVFARPSKPAFFRSFHATSCHGSHAYPLVVSRGLPSLITAIPTRPAAIVVVAPFGCSTNNFRLDGSAKPSNAHGSRASTVLSLAATSVRWSKFGLLGSPVPIGS